MSIDVVKQSLPKVFIYILTSLAGVIMFFVRDTYAIVKETHEKIIAIEAKTELKLPELDNRIERIENKLFTLNNNKNGKSIK